MREGDLLLRASILALDLATCSVRVVAQSNARPRDWDPRIGACAGGCRKNALEGNNGRSEVVGRSQTGEGVSHGCL